MRSFWVAIALLAVLAAAVLWARSSTGPRNEPRPADAASGGDRSPGPEQTPAPTPPPTPPAIEPYAQPDSTDQAEPAGTPLDDDAEFAALTAPSPQALGAAISGALGDAPPPPPSGVGAQTLRRDDGSLLVNGRFTVRGDGSEQAPFEVPWDMLVAASETYKPRLGQTRLPEWLEMLNDKHVRITGFIAFPIMAQSPDEMLVMLNQWDGCCIGVPPTPYDAVEVKLASAVQGNDRLKVFGTVQGLFKVDPYLVKDWLIGLYTMSDAKLSNTSGDQTSPHVPRLGQP